MKSIQMVDLHGQYQNIQNEVQQAINQVIADSAFIKGNYVARFEKQLADYLQAKHVVGCGNGTDALQIALMALDLQPGDEVIVPSFTFIATAEVIALLGLKPVFVDVCPDSFNILPAAIEQAIGPKTKAVMPVHLYGQPADMGEILQIAQRHGLYVIEDAAQATGASYTFADGTTKKAGTMGHIGCTSFFPSKNLGAFGDGGALFTDDDALAKKIRMIANHGSRQKYYHEVVGVNSRLDGLQAAILDVKLKYLDAYNEKRRVAAARYNELFADIASVSIPVQRVYGKHIFHQYTLQVPTQERDRLKKYLKEIGIPSMVYYPVPMHRQRAFAHLHDGRDACKTSEQLAQTVLSLPMHTELTAEQQEYIAGEVRGFFRA